LSLQDSTLPVRQPPLGNRVYPLPELRKDRGHFQHQLEKQDFQYKTSENSLGGIGTLLFILDHDINVLPQRSHSLHILPTLLLHHAEIPFHPRLQNLLLILEVIIKSAL